MYDVRTVGSVGHISWYGLIYVRTMKLMLGIWNIALGRDQPLSLLGGQITIKDIN